MIKKELKAERVSEKKIKECSAIILRVREEISKVLIGQDKIVDSLVRALLCNGHVLIEGVPGIAKTLSVRALARVIGGKEERIQFTVDLLPSDIVGITTYTPKKGFSTLLGPIFANFVIADEINRSPPKTQSALIEAMQEKQVTIGKKSYPLPLPFFVMATQNPLETSGVYSLPEAQIDRFLFKVNMGYPQIEEESRIMEQNMTLKKFEEFDLKPVTSPARLAEMQELVKDIYMDKKVKDYILRIIEHTRKKDFKNGQYIEWGASPRASIGLFIASKAQALIHGRNYVIPKDVEDVVYDVLRHRIILSYKANIEGIHSENLISEILKIVNKS